MWKSTTRKLLRYHLDFVSRIYFLYLILNLFHAKSGMAEEPLLGNGSSALLSLAFKWVSRMVLDSAVPTACHGQHIPHLLTLQMMIQPISNTFHFPRASGCNHPHHQFLSPLKCLYLEKAETPTEPRQLQRISREGAP